MNDKQDAKEKLSLMDQEALIFHAQGRPGKLEIIPSKPMATQRDLSLAYSPGVAAPVRAIYEDPQAAFKYTTRGNLVAVISNGTAILGLGNLGALASKPVMEGKAVLFKRFADVDSIDLEVSTEEPEEFINCVRYLGASFGGINLEDIKAPECFIIEKSLREIMDIPVFHDDQHGTAIIAGAGLLNALHLTKREAATSRIIINGAGAAGIACAELMCALGFVKENIIFCDRTGVIYSGRTKGMNEWKEAYAIDTPLRTLDEALKGADIFLGLSAKGAMTPEMVASMANQPIIFALANPDPEILPEEVASVRDDAIVATGRSDYPNQVNNVLGFPYIFRGALDVRAVTINMEMKIAAAQALAALAQEHVPDEVAIAYRGARPRFGRDYIIPVPFDPRLIHVVPPAVAKAAMESGVARFPIENFAKYKEDLSARRDPVVGLLNRIFQHVRRDPKRVVFAEGEEEQVIRAALAFTNNGMGQAILVGNEERIYANAEASGINIRNTDIEIQNARISQRRDHYTHLLYGRLQRSGFLFRDCQRLINQDRNHFAAAMLASGEAEALVSGVTRNYSGVLRDVRRVLDIKSGHRLIGFSIALARGHTVLVADTTITDMPTAEDIANITLESASVARRFGYEPRIALLSCSNFGHPPGKTSELVQNAVRILKDHRVDFEYEGEMTPDVALNRDLHANYPFSRLTGPANVLIMPSASAASISTKMLQELGGSTVIGPLISGLDKSVQILPLGASESTILNLAVLAAYGL